jgi:hypothetical protein
MKPTARTCATCAHCNPDPSLGEPRCWEGIRIVDGSLREPMPSDSCIHHLTPAESAAEDEILDSCADHQEASALAQAMHDTRAAIRQAAYFGGSL